MRLHEKYVRLVRDYLAHHNGRPESSEDLLQEVFTRVWEHRGQYQPGTPVPAYLLGFARNVVREHKARTRYERLICPSTIGPIGGQPSDGPDSAPIPNGVR